MTPTPQPVIAITGASMGLGYALAKELLQLGISVSICARRTQQLKQALQSLAPLGNVVGFTGDVAAPYFRGHFVKQTLERFGRLDGIVNNASTLGDLPLPQLSNTSAANFRNVFEVNTFAPMMLIQEASPYLERQKKAIVLSLSSDAAVGGYPGWGVYGSSKAALDLLTKTWAAERPAGPVVFYSVDPSDMQTDMHEAASPGDEGLADPADVAKVISRLFHPLLDGSEFPYPSGSRMQVSGQNLVLKEER
ncbi:SDR family NAD(P)-dependent oxidoreductase [Alicyclobacillus pomorum]|uniref:SDR family NAD(P)-dependent oxidoreductase n=1 Tax=Alicyclobacillus pomorum TaxID=204470 RepID=UPI00042897ED|nr:SDR family oxidoreductase [Alicyclobacillus pomorum]